MRTRCRSSWSLSHILVSLRVCRGHYNPILFWPQETQKGTKRECGRRGTLNLHGNCRRDRAEVSPLRHHENAPPAATVCPQVAYVPLFLGIVIAPEVFALRLHN